MASRGNANVDNTIHPSEVWTETLPGLFWALGHSRHPWTPHPDGDHQAQKSEIAHPHSRLTLTRGVGTGKRAHTASTDPGAMSPGACWGQRTSWPMR